MCILYFVGLVCVSSGRSFFSHPECQSARRPDVAWCEEEEGMQSVGQRERTAAPLDECVYVRDDEAKREEDPEMPIILIAL